MYSRRTFGKLALTAVPAGALLAKGSKVNGVMIGAQSYSFRDRPLDEAIKAMSDIGLSYVELWQGHIEPPRGSAPEVIKKWRTSPEALQQLREVRKKFGRAGIQIYALNYSFRRNYSDEEVARGMEMAKVLGTKYITASSTVSQAKRINDFARKAGVFVAMHNHSNLKDPDEFAKPESFLKAMEGNSNIKINLDIGHFTAANFDPVEFLDQHHRDIVTLHVKDRKRDQGANVPFGEGDTKIKEVLQLLKAKKYAIPANIEYEYKGADTVAEVRRCYEYCRQALSS
ncbi:MAG: sugar phosphate isomerase/epimerase [Acidobacteria bacterium]|nr:sugar phosphate isomerase/epimerase [Acidobacteriota bacterium]MBI3281468.1 sugar phosphate isomerase/epimerase [Acidobacteriota bacterium]